MKITINNKRLIAREGQTILEAARAHGVYIPTLCYHEKIGALARCRACAVEVKGRPALITACNTPVLDGMEIVTNSERAIEAQRFVIKLALSSGNHDCMICEKSGECELQDAAYNLGLEDADLWKGDRAPRFDDSSAFIRMDHARCILCGRCVEACSRLVVNRVARVMNRGYDSKIGFGSDLSMGDSPCVQCGECTQVCPVGALTAKKSIGKARLRDVVKTRTTCPYCGVGCQLDLHVREGRIVKVTGAEQGLPNRGRLCVKGRYGYDFIYSKDRLKTPLIKENGEFREASWDEALDLVASKFKEIIEKHGPDAVAGVSCARSTNEDSYQMQKLFRAVFKTNNIDHCART
jgi:predicted molibdopterin-dependent oxidoreductase YjgC